jgi:hypothetical protein
MIPQAFDREEQVEWIPQRRINLTVREISISVDARQKREAEIAISFLAGALERGFVWAKPHTPLPVRELKSGPVQRRRSKASFGLRAGLAGFCAAMLALAAFFGSARTQVVQPTYSGVTLEIPESKQTPAPPSRNNALPARRLNEALKREVKPGVIAEPKKPPNSDQLKVDLWSLAPVQEAVARALTSGEMQTWQLGSIGGYVTATPDKSRACWSLLLWGRGWAQGETLRQRRCAADIDVEQPRLSEEEGALSTNAAPTSTMSDPA